MFDRILHTTIVSRQGAAVWMPLALRDGPRRGSDRSLAAIQTAPHGGPRVPA